MGQAPTFFFFEMLCFFVSFVLFLSFYMFPKKNKKMDMGVGGCDLANPSFSRIFGMFST